MTRKPVWTDPEKKWAIEVGRFMLAFGDIEHTAIACLCAIPKDAFGKITASMALGVRLDLLTAVLEGKKEKEYEELAALVDEIKKFLDHRNLVAHNPVQFSFYKKKDGPGILFQTELISTRNRNKRLTFEQLQDLSDEAERLANDFGQVALDVFQAYHWDDIQAQDA